MWNIRIKICANTNYIKSPQIINKDTGSAALEYRNNNLNYKLAAAPKFKNPLFSIFLIMVQLISKLIF